MAQTRTALITGASTGLGYEFCHLAAKDGHAIILVARSKDKLDALAQDLSTKYKVQTKVIAKDLSKENAADEVMQEIDAAGLKVDFLFNNAGFAVWGRFENTDWKSERELLQVNIVALTQFTKLTVKGMTERKFGRIMNVASMAGFVPGPMMAVYFASKAYVLSLSEALANELKGSGVTVTALCPGPTDTQFEARAGLERSRLFTILKGMDAKVVAKDGYHGMMKGEQVIIPGALNQVMAISSRIAPRELNPQILRFIQEAKSAN